MSAGPLKPGNSEGTGAFLGFDAIEQVSALHRHLFFKGPFTKKFY
jgi:hypothetical protein